MNHTQCMRKKQSWQKNTATAPFFAPRHCRNTFPAANNDSTEAKKTQKNGKIPVDLGRARGDLVELANCVQI